MPIDFPFPLTLETGAALVKKDSLAAWIGFTPVLLEPGRVEALMTITASHIAPNGFLHAAVVTALADIACGFGTTASLPSKDVIFTTLEIKINLLGTARQGVVTCAATARHIGAKTHVWDAEVWAEKPDKPIALFRCTQMLIENR